MCMYMIIQSLAWCWCSVPCDLIIPADSLSTSTREVPLQVKAGVKLPGWLLGAIAQGVGFDSRQLPWLFQLAY